MNIAGRKRDPAIELFRCFLMFLIVLGHCWGGGSFTPWDSSHIVSRMDWWAFFLVSMLIWHVDGFIVISGWFGIRFSWKKFFHLLGIIFFYTLFSQIVDICSGMQYTNFRFWGMRSGWFGGSYLVLMLTAPLLNAAIDGLASKSKRILFFAYMLAFIGFLFSWMPYNGLTGINAIGYGHQTYVMMVFVYVTARVARYLLIATVKKRYLIYGIAGWLLMITVWWLIGNNILGNVPGKYFVPFCALIQRNHSPLVFLPAILFLLTFVWYIKIPERIAKTVLFVSPSMFGVYLFHCFHGGILFRYPETFLYSTFHWHPLIILWIVAFFVFGVSVLVDLMRRGICYWIQPVLDSGLNKLDQHWMDWIAGKHGRA